MNIWCTIEADAWSRDFDYAGYVRFCDLLSDKKPVSKTEYQLLCAQFDEQMALDLAED